MGVPISGVRGLPCKVWGPPPVGVRVPHFRPGTAEMPRPGDIDDVMGMRAAASFGGLVPPDSQAAPPTVHFRCAVDSTACQAPDRPATATQDQHVVFCHRGRSPRLTKANANCWSRQPHPTCAGDNDVAAPLRGPRRHLSMVQVVRAMSQRGCGGAPQGPLRRTDGHQANGPRVRIETGGMKNGLQPLAHAHSAASFHVFRC